MYLKSLELNGFKSFAEKTVLTFLPPVQGAQSITAVVGPNGSGKSNIADAIRWVLGEQSMKTLRGKKSEDIIFGGSESKGKMGMASVALTIDNRDGVLPIEEEELVVSRRAYRTGENEYLINGREVRLLDLQLLLAKAQFGQGSYSVIGQGMIDRLLLQTPAERKDFFDEAFGIKEFQIKRHQAILKLTRTKEHIGQAEALLNEVSPRLKTLSRQVKKLEERQEVEIELREAEESYFMTLWRHNQDQLDEVRQSLLVIDQAFRESQKKLTIIQEELAGLARESSRQEAFDELQRMYRDVQQQKNALERSRAALQGRMQVEYNKAGKQNVGWLEKKIEEMREEQGRQMSLLAEADTILERITKEIQEKKTSSERVSVARMELRTRLSALESSLAQAKSEQNFFHLTGLKAVEAILEEGHRFGRVYGAVAQLAEVDEKYQLAMDVAAGAHLSSLVVADDEVAKACIGYLREHQLGVATFLPLTKMKSRLLPHDVHDLVASAGVHGLAIELARFDRRFEHIFSYVFGSTLIVQDIDAARRIGIGRIRMVTLEGDVLETSGSMKGGYRRKKTIGLSFANAQAPHMMQNQLMDHTEAMTQAKKELDETEMQYEEMQDRLRELHTSFEIERKKQQLLSDRKKNIDQELAAFEQELSLSTMSEEEYGAVMKDIVFEKEALDTSLAALDDTSKTLEEKMGHFHQEEEDKKRRIFALQDAMQAEQAALNTIASGRGEKQVAAAKLETRQEDLANEVYQELRTSIDAIAKRAIQLIRPEELEHAQTRIQKLKYTLSLIGGIDEEVVKEYEETRVRHEGLTAQLDDLSKALSDLEGLVVELDDIMKKKRAKGFKEIQKEFRRYFSLLFDGGKADLVEVYGEESDESNDAERNAEEGTEEGEAEGVPQSRRQKMLTGIEVAACPPGKKIRHIAALSGGERTLTSIALICAILHSNPPPFVVLDEVEAALDEANTLRFTTILQELAKQSQFVLITHNRATMHAAHALYGVTMGGSGMSRLLSVKIEQGAKAGDVS